MSRRTLLVAALVASVAAAGWGGGGQVEPSPPQPVAPRAAATPAVQLAAVDIDSLRRRSVAQEFADIFPPRTWEVQRRVQQVVEAPRAPPLPFVYMGRMVEGGAVTVFLAAGERSIVAREGETIDGRYRVEEIGRAQLTLTYLPLDERQSLRTAEAE